MCKSFASQSCTSRSLGWGQVRGRGSPSKSHFLENPRNSVHSSCSASENTQKMLHFLTRTQEKCWGLWGCARSRKWGQRIQGHQVEENSWSPQSHLPPGAHYHQNHLPPATFNCMIFVLFFMLCFCSGFMLKLIKYVGVSAWQTAREENKTFHLQASAPHLDKQEQHKWTVGQHWGGTAPSQLLIISENGAVVQRKWSQQSPGEGERAPPRLGPCWWHPSGCAGVLSSAGTKESKQVI